MGDMQGNTGRDNYGRRRPGILGWNVSSPAQSPASSDQQIDPARLKMIENQLLENQNFGLGMLAGLIAAMAGSVVWGLLTYATEYQIGFMAIGIGFVIGMAIKRFGAGYSAIYGIGGAVLALGSCLLGNLIFACLVIAREYKLAFFDVFSRLNFEITWEIMKAGFNGMDILFYIIAIYCGYKYSIRDLKKDQMAKLAGFSPSGGPTL